MPRMHPREMPTNKAESDLSEAIHKVIEEYELTDGEALRVVNAALSKWLGNYAKITIREERHGNSETPGGWAPDG
jgi:hypothetical protein